AIFERRLTGSINNSGTGQYRCRITLLRAKQRQEYNIENSALNHDLLSGFKTVCLLRIGECSVILLSVSADGSEGELEDIQHRRILFLDSLHATLRASIIGQKPKAKKAEVWRPLRDRVNCS